jgi:hypothetical protein
MIVTRLHSGRSEDSETGSDSQESDELFHCELGLIRCRHMSGLSSTDETPLELFSSHPFFLSHEHRTPRRI